MKNVKEFSFPSEFGFTGSAGKSHVSAHERAKPMKRGGPFAGHPLKKGALHRSLGVPAGEKIPAGKLRKAEHSSNPLTAKRARLAETMKHWHHKKEGGPVEAREYAETEPDEVAPGREDQYKRGGHVHPGGKHHYKHGGHVKQAEHEAKGGHVKEGGRHQFAKGGLTHGPEKREHEGEFEDYKRGGHAKHRYAEGGQVQRDEHEAGEFKRGGKAHKSGGGKVVHGEFKRGGKC